LSDQQNPFGLSGNKKPAPKVRSLDDNFDQETKRSTKDLSTNRIHISKGGQLPPKVKDPAEIEEEVKSSLIKVLCIIQFLSNSSFSLMAPFYPLKAKERNIDVIWVGFVIGIMAIMQIVSGVVVGKYLHRIGGRNPIIMIGSILIIS